MLRCFPIHAPVRLGWVDFPGRGGFRHHNFPFQVATKAACIHIQQLLPSMFSHWRRHSSIAKSAAPRRRLHIEALEKRRLLAVSFEFNYLGGNSVGFNDPSEGPTFKAALESASSRLGGWLLHDAAISMDVGSYPFDGTAVATASSVNSGPSATGGFVPALVPAKIMGGDDFNGSNADGRLDVFFFDAGDVFTYQTDPAQGIADDEIDLQAVIIHELIHAIGFTSATRIDGSDDSGNGVFTPGTWSLFDRFLSDVDGNRMIESDAQASNAFQMDVSANGWPTHSVGGKGPDAGLFFDGPIATQVHGGRVPLFSPATFSLSSSVSHLDSEGYPNDSFVFSPETHTMSQAIVDLDVPQDLTLLEIAMLADIGIMVDARDDISITWPDPADIEFGTLLDATQLSASANVPGTFVYDPPAGTMLDAGQGQSLSVSFVPDDLAVSSPVAATATINVLQVQPTVEWPAPAPIVFGTLLGQDQLNAVAKANDAQLPGTYVYDPPIGTRLNPGTDQQLSVTFQPDDGVNYAEVIEIVTIDVLPSNDFATLDGSFNNLDNILLGAAPQHYLRQTTVSYEDGISEPRGGDPSNIANPRAISNAVNAQVGDVPSGQLLSNMVFQFGQFLDHDIGLAPTTDDPFNIPVPLGDPLFDPHVTGTQVIPLSRSEFDPATGTDIGNPRHQSNVITSFVDGSSIYGSDDARSFALRVREGGRMIMRDDGMLALNGVDTILLSNASAGGADPESFFVSGDVRVNEQVGLTAMHTLFNREHNYWADRIAEEQYSGQDLSDAAIDEEIYQKARRIVAAELQIITYSEFLPMVLGENMIAEYQEYDDGVDPRISNIFATAAYRVGHTMLPDELALVDASGQVTESLPLANAFFRPQVLFDNGIDPILRGLVAKPQQEIDRFVVDGVRNFLFGPPGAGGLDLASLNIQRGRDHGLPTYNQVRVDFGLTPAASFAEISSDLDTQAALASVYGSVDDVDIWVGGLSEDHVAGANLGQTFATIWVDQFERLRDGDRYFYLNQSWDSNLLSELESTKLSDIILRNSEIDVLPDNVFRVAFEDFGDAPFDIVSPRYPTLRMSNGARHFVGDLRLGQTIDSEPNGQPSPLADGDGSDEDGITPIASPIATVDSDTGASFVVVASAQGKLDGWIDFNRDGDWLDPGEQIAASIDVTAGENFVGYTIPAGTDSGDLFARFRLSTRGGLMPTGPAHDGEVEDYLVTTLDGGQSPEVTIDLPVTSVLVSSESGRVILSFGSAQLFQAPTTILGSLTLRCSPADDAITFDTSNPWMMPSGGFEVDGSGGENTLAVTGGGTLTLNANPSVGPGAIEGESIESGAIVRARNFGTLDLSSPDANTLSINAAAVAELAPASHTVRVVAGEGDAIQVTDAADWRMAQPIVDDGSFVLTAGNAAAGGAESIEAIVAHAWQNFLQPGDVNNDGEVTASDVLRIINELDRRDFSDNVTSDLPDPSTVALWPQTYFDHSGDDRATALDALQIINLLTRLAQGGGSGEAAAIQAEPLVASRMGHPHDDITSPINPANIGDSGELIVDASMPETIASNPVSTEAAAELTEQSRIAAVDELLADDAFFDFSQ